MAVTLRYDWSNRLNELTGIAAKPELTDLESAIALALTRTTTAAFVDWESTVRYVAAGEERYTGARRVENLMLQSSDFSDGQWLTARAAKAATTARDLTETAIIVTQANGEAVHGAVYTVIAEAPTEGYTVTLSCEAKKHSTSNFIVVADNLWDATANKTWFNLSTGAVGTTAPEHTASIEDLGDGWYRCSITVEHTTDGNEFVLFYTADTDGSVTVAGDGSSTFIMSSPQLEIVHPAGDITPSEYLATTAAPVVEWYATNKSGAAINPAGLLVEEDRTNICLRSSEITNAPWDDNGTIATANDFIAPDGSRTADTLVDSNIGGSGSAWIDQSVSLVDETAYTFSGYFKADQRDWVFLWFDKGVSNTGRFFDLTNGVIGGVINDTPDDSRIEDVGNGWYRCSITGTASATGATDFRVMLAEADGDIIFSRDRSHSIQVWGAQIEAGTFPTSYIPTVASSVTRNSDDIAVADVTWYTAATGTLYCKGKTTKVKQGTDAIMVAVAGGGNLTNSLRLNFNAGVQGQAEARHVTGTGDDGVVLLGGVLTDDVYSSLVVAYADDDLKMFADGSEGTQDTSVTVPSSTAFNELVVGGAPQESNYFNGHISEIIYDNTRKIDSELADWSNDLELPGAESAAEALEGIVYPRDAMALDEARFHDFITASGITATGDLVRDYRHAMYAAAGLTGKENDYSIDDAFKRYFNSL